MVFINEVYPEKEEVISEGIIYLYDIATRMKEVVKNINGELHGLAMIKADTSEWNRDYADFYLETYHKPEMVRQIIGEKLSRQFHQDKSIVSFRSKNYYVFIRMWNLY